MIEFRHLSVARWFEAFRFDSFRQRHCFSRRDSNCNLRFFRFGQQAYRFQKRRVAFPHNVAFNHADYKFFIGAGR